VLVFGDLLEFGFIVGLVLCVVHPQRIGGLDQVVTEILIARFAHVGFLCLKVSRLVSFPGQTSKLGEGLFGVESVDLSNL